MNKSSNWIIMILIAALLIGSTVALISHRTPSEAPTVPQDNTPGDLMPSSPTEPTEPPTEPTEPPTEPTEPPTEPTEPPTEPTEPPTEPTEPPTEPTEPPTEPTEPPTEPTEPPTEPTEPPTEPTEPPTEPTSPRTEPQAPNIVVYDAQGNPVSLSDFIGKPIVINFWASWCGPCQMEMPEFQAIYQELGDQVQFLMVNLTTYDDMASAKAFIHSGGYSFPVFFDLSGSAGHLYAVYAFPTTYFIDAEGYIIDSYVGAMSHATLHYYIDKIL